MYEEKRIASTIDLIIEANAIMGERAVDGGIGRRACLRRHLSLCGQRQGEAEEKEGDFGVHRRDLKK